MGIKYLIKDFWKSIQMNKSAMVILLTKMMIHQTLNFTHRIEKTIKEMIKVKKMKLARSMKTIILIKREKPNKILYESYVLQELKLKSSRISTAKLKHMILFIILRIYCKSRSSLDFFRLFRWLIDELKEINQLLMNMCFIWIIFCIDMNLQVQLQSKILKVSLRMEKVCLNHKRIKNQGI